MPRNARAIADSLSETDRIVWRDLQRMPNVGPAIAHDLIRLGIRRPDDLRGKDPDDLYERLSELDGVRHDPCLRDTMAAVISYAETGDTSPWWYFTPQRKGPRS